MACTWALDTSLLLSRARACNARMQSNKPRRLKLEHGSMVLEHAALRKLPSLTLRVAGKGVEGMLPCHAF